MIYTSPHQYDFLRRADLPAEEKRRLIGEALGHIAMLAAIVTIPLIMAVVGGCMLVFGPDGGPSGVEELVVTVATLALSTLEYLVVVNTVLKSRVYAAVQMAVASKRQGH